MDPITPRQVDVRHAGGTVTVDAEHVDWLDTTFITINTPGGKLQLMPHEAKELAEALLSAAGQIEEANK